MQGHKDWVTSIAVDPAHGKAVTASRDCTARIWSIGAGGSCDAVLGGHPGEVAAAQFVATAGGPLRVVTGCRFADCNTYLVPKIWSMTANTATQAKSESRSLWLQPAGPCVLSQAAGSPTAP